MNAVMNPYGNLPAIKNASTDIETGRAVAELQAAVMLARRFPRDPRQCVDNVLLECQRESLAEAALYTYARGGQDISGPSIRLAETIARNWGNIDFGIKEITQAGGRSEMMAYAWDLETNVRQTKVFIVEHVRHTKKGTKELTDPRDIYETVANNGARRLRACILGIVPKDVIDVAVEQCEATAKAKTDASPEAVKKMISAFQALGVTKEQIEKRIQRRIDAIAPAQIISLRKIYTSIKDEMSKPEDWFEVGPQAPTTTPVDASAVDQFNATANSLNMAKIEEFLSPVADAMGLTVDQAKARIVLENDFPALSKNYASWVASQTPTAPVSGPDSSENEQLFELTDFFNNVKIDAAMNKELKARFNAACEASGIEPGSRPTTVGQGEKFRAALGEYNPDPGPETGRDDIDVF